MEIFFPRFVMRRAGFALIEMLLVVGILSVVTSMSVPLYMDYQIRNDLNLATEQVTQGLSRARLLSQSAEHDDGWGFFVPAGILYKGESYEARDPSFDEVYPMPSTITPSGLFEVAYTKIDGAPSATGAITLTTLNNEQRTVLITVQKESVAVVENDVLTICHFPPGNPENGQTIQISDASWPTHRDVHGDTLGPCPDASSSAASSAPASSSSQATSQQSSSSVQSSPTSGASSSQGGTPTCEDRFYVQDDGTIVTTGPLDITWRALGSEVTFGNGGPEIQVTVKYSKDDGKKWKKLFQGKDIDGGESQTVSNITTGSKVLTKIRGTYQFLWWLTFDQEYTSNDQTGHVITLRDGDELPDYPAFGNQQNLTAFLQDIVDEDGRIDIGPYDAVLLVELFDLFGIGIDFQDAVLLMEFSDPPC